MTTNNVQLEVIGSIEKLSIQPGDVLVVKVPIGCATKNVLRRMEETLRGMLGNDLPILIIEGNVEMKVVRNDAVPS
jgi:hypothetical protein